MSQRSRHGVAAHAGWAWRGLGHDVVDVVAVGEREVPDLDRCVERRHGRERLAEPLVVTDPQRMLGAQLATDRLDGGRVRGLQLGVVGGQRGVRDSESAHAASLPQPRSSTANAGMIVPDR